MKSQHSLRLGTFAYVFSILLIATACTKKSESAKFSIVLPPHPDVSNKGVTTLTDKRFCFFINVTGPGINGETRTCSPAVGLATKSQSPNSAIELMVPQGEGRRIDLFGYIPSSSETCESMNKQIHETEANRLFLMGSAKDVVIKGSEVTVTLTSAFPGVSRPFAVVTGQPSSCWAHLPLLTDTDNPGSVGGYLRGERFAVQGAIGSGVDSRIQSGSHFKIQSEVKYVAH